MRLPSPPVTMAAAAGAVLLSVAVASIATTGAKAGAPEVPPTVQPISSVELVCPVAASVKVCLPGDLGRRCGADDVRDRCWR